MFFRLCRIRSFHGCARQICAYKSQTVVCLAGKYDIKGNGSVVIRVFRRFIAAQSIRIIFKGHKLAFGSTVLNLLECPGIVLSGLAVHITGNNFHQRVIHIHIALCEGDRGGSGILEISVIMYEVISLRIVILYGKHRIQRIPYKGEFCIFCRLVPILIRHIKGQIIGAVLGESQLVDNFSFICVIYRILHILLGIAHFGDCYLLVSIS